MSFEAGVVDISPIDSPTDSVSQHIIPEYAYTS